MEMPQSLINIDVFVGGAPLLISRLCAGLVEFGRTHPQWRFSLRSSNFRYDQNWLKQQNIAGVLALIDTEPIAGELSTAKIPWVHLLPSRIVPHAFVDVDDRGIGRLGAGFFMRKGFFKCAFCGTGTDWSRERFYGFSKCLSESGRKCDFMDIPYSPHHAWGLSSEAEALLGCWLRSLDKGTAIMAAHDDLANHIIDQCLRMNIRVPQDIIVMGVGNHELFCKLSPVAISSIDASLEQVAIQGASVLDKMIRGEIAPEPIMVHPAGIIERRSTDFLNYGDTLVNQIVTYIRDHACEPVNVNDLTRIFPLSRRTMSRRFAKYVGHSPADEIAMVRLETARRMISSTKMSLSEIAFACGYADLSHMDRTFLNKCGASPGSFRDTPLHPPR